MSRRGIGVPCGRVGTGRFLSIQTAGITPSAKTQKLVASSLPAATPRFPQKLEGLGIARDGRLIGVHDDDFGITNQRTQINLVTGVLE